VRTAILVLLAEQPRHGYDLIRAIEERSQGMWSPSPGSVYPTLQALEDEGLVTIDSVDGRKTASLTAEGQEWVSSHSGEGEAVFATPDGADKTHELMHELRSVAEAATHVARQHDSPELSARAVAILASARKELYRLLADDGE
jgi:DNA-binding PadR family transcriptional regulator